MLVVLIAACEIGFWVVLAAGLLARYGLKWPRVGAALLVCVPLVDLILLAATLIDLRGGATATAAHGLAAAYLGFSVAFGHQVIANLDARASHRFAGGPAPVAPPQVGPGRVRHSWHQWRRGAAAWAIACGLLLGAIILVDDPDRTAQLTTWVLWLSVALLLWLFLGPLLTQVRELDQLRRQPNDAMRKTQDNDQANPVS
ncbi:hypothetical protein GCM10011584_05360 [Nocardioides phosphati]|uniref:Integral membrane protein n=1 Tax=Nocardioides phosphati TaxID=1867775 RepID=A0ABQ2N6W7_9ACTN|nr:hypothetical protein [Nocardioides phosphati]GGO85424.1 hypothetical protein GCM10011584_05360 [Nocardioides phosphati]